MPLAFPKWHSTAGNVECRHIRVSGNPTKHWKIKYHSHFVPTLPQLSDQHGENVGWRHLLMYCCYDRVSLPTGQLGTGNKVGPMNLKYCNRAGQIQQRRGKQVIGKSHISSSICSSSINGANVKSQHQKTFVPLTNNTSQDLQIRKHVAYHLCSGKFWCLL